MAVNQGRRKRVRLLEKRSTRRKVYQGYAGQVISKDLYEQDHLVAQKIAANLCRVKQGSSLNEEDKRKLKVVLLQGPVAQQLKQTEGTAAAYKYVQKVTRATVERLPKKSQYDYVR